jgi:hypothetical protein
MAQQTWSLIPKSQTDDETIEQAIARLILEHEADEASHLGAGESLQSHKAAEIIDHLAESIIEDKIGDGAVSSRCITSDQIIGKDFRTAADVGAGADGVKFNTDGVEMWQGGSRKVKIPISGDPYFAGPIFAKRPEYQNIYLSSQYESIDGWDVAFTGTDGSVVASVCNLDLRPGDENGSYARIASEFGGQSINWSNDDPVIETVLRHTDKSSSDMWFSLGQYVINGTGNQMGFSWRGSLQKLYAKWGTVGNSYGAEITGIDVELWHKYRVEKIGAAIYFYIDGVLKHTATTNLPSGEDDLILVLSATTVAAGTFEVLSRRILFAKDN